jgi:hypothetical protein
VATLGAERINHEVNDAFPADVGKMAACDPEAAIWVVLTRADARASSRRCSIRLVDNYVSRRLTAGIPPEQAPVGYSGSVDGLHRDASP